MQSNNPVFGRSEAFSSRGGYATFNTPSAGDLQGMYDAPAATARDTGRMTLDDVVMRTAMLFAVLLTTAAATFFVWQPRNMLPIIGAAIVALVLGLVITFSKTIRPPLMLTYAAFEGVFVGGLSLMYADRFSPGLIPQAILGTLAGFAGMLVAYRTGIVRNSPRFTKVLMIAAIGYMIFGFLNIILSVFNVGGWTNVYSGGGLLALGLSAFGVVLSAFFLVLDFDQIERGLEDGAPEQFAWVAGFGLMVTLVWMYLEILRFLSILNSDD